MNQVISIQNLKFVSLNRKYIKNRYTGQLMLSTEYRNFKDLITLSVRKGFIEPPYRVRIEMETPQDIDNSLKAIFDAIQQAGVIDNDRNILEANLIKTPVKKGQAGSLKVFIETINEA